MANASRETLWPSLGGEVCEWIETYLWHGPGDVQDQPLELDDEFRAFIWRAYEVFPKGHAKAGRRRYQRAFLSRPKGRAKSEIAGAIACAEALGPVRFDGWRRNKPIGRPVTAPWVRCFATEEGQAGNTFDNVIWMLENGAAIDEYDGLDVGLTRVIIPGGGSIEAVTSAAGSKDGGKDTFDVFDETHLWTGRPLHRLHDTVTRNLSKRRTADGWALETSTMYGLGEGSVAEATHTYARQGDDDGLLFDHRQAPDGIDLDDDEAVLAGLRHVYGPAAAWMDVEGILKREFRNPAKTEADNRRYWFNQPVKLARRLFDPDTLTNLERPERVVEPGTRVVVGFNGSINHDATSLVAWTVEDIPHLFTIKVWPTPAVPGITNAASAEEVDAVVRDTFERYDVARLACVVLGWRAEIEGWTADFGDDVVIAFDHNQPSKMAPATDRLDAAIKQRAVTWDGDGQLRAHLIRCDRKDSHWGPLAVRPDGNSDEKIEGAIAAIISHAELAHAGPADQPSTPQVWDLNEVAAQIVARRQAEAGGVVHSPAGPSTHAQSGVSVRHDGARFIRF